MKIFLFLPLFLFLNSISNVFASYNTDKEFDKYYLTANGGVNFFFPGSNVLKKSFKDTPMNGASMYNQEFILSSLQLYFGYMFFPRFGIDLHLGTINYKLYSSDNIFDAFQLKYISELLKLDDIRKPFQRMKPKHGKVLDALEDLELVQSEVFFHVIPISLGGLFNCIDRDRFKMFIRVNLGGSITQVSSAQNFNFTKLTTFLRSEPDMRTKFKAFYGDTKGTLHGDVKADEDNNSKDDNLEKNFPKKIFNSIGSNINNLDDLSHKFDYTIKFKKNFQFYTSLGINFEYAIYKGLNFSTSVMLNYVSTIKQLVVDQYLDHSGKQIKDEIEDFWGIKYLNKSDSQIFNFDSGLLSYSVFLGFTFNF